MTKELRITDKERIIYSLNVEDLQTVATEELSRELTEEEMKIVEDKLGIHIPWYNTISLAIDDMLHEQEKE